MMCAVCMFDGRRQEELIDLKDGQIDELRALLRETRALLRESRRWVAYWEHPPAEALVARIDAALAGEKK